MLRGNNVRIWCETLDDIINTFNAELSDGDLIILNEIVDYLGGRPCPHGCKWVHECAVCCGLREEEKEENAPTKLRRKPRSKTLPKG